MMSADAVASWTGLDAHSALRAAIVRARSKVWVRQFAVDIRPSSDVDGAVRYLLHAFAEARARGIDVRVLLSSVLTHGDAPVDINAPAIRFLRSRGVPVRTRDEQRERRVHEKYWRIDSDFCAVTNGNFTPSAVLGSDRIVAALSPSLAQYLDTRFLQQWGDDGQ